MDMSTLDSINGCIGTLTGVGGLIISWISLCKIKKVNFAVKKVSDDMKDKLTAKHNIEYIQSVKGKLADAKEQIIESYRSKAVFPSVKLFSVLSEINSDISQLIGNPDNYSSLELSKSDLKNMKSLSEEINKVSTLNPEDVNNEQVKRELQNSVGKVYVNICEQIERWKHNGII